MQKKQTPQRKRAVRGWHVILMAAGLAGGLGIVPPLMAAEAQSYQALRHWLEQYRTAEPAFAAGQHLALKDRAVLEPFIPQSAWEYYFFSDLDMEIAPVGHYPPSPEWGEKVKAGYYLDEQGVLVGFTGGGFPFPEIKPDDPQAAVKVIWNMWWRPGAEDYVMPMVSWLRGEGGRLDRRFEFIATLSRYARGDHSLVPGYEEVWSKSLRELRSPRDVAGGKNLTIKYLDHHKEDDGWLYIPSQRKARRVLASERTDEVLAVCRRGM